MKHPSVLNVNDHRPNQAPESKEHEPGHNPEGPAQGDHCNEADIPALNSRSNGRVLSVWEAPWPGVTVEVMAHQPIHRPREEDDGHAGNTSPGRQEV